MQSDIERIMNGYKNADEAANYAEAIKLEASQISGTDYKLIWTAAYTGGYPPRQ